MKQLDFALILVCTIDPKDMPHLVRKDVQTRLDDYKKSFKFWINNDLIKKIIFIENSGYDISYFKDASKSITNKKIEFISSNSNNTFDKKLGKGYGHHLSIKEIFNSSNLAKDTNYFIDVTGRYIVKNFEFILGDIKFNEADIYINLTDFLKFADANIYAGSKKFFCNYIVPETKKTNDNLNNIYENCVANATLKAISDGMTLSKTPIYADIDGYIGTNGKKYRQNTIKKIKLHFFRKLKNYFFKHKKY
jgi:hypothetical protein|tara:strand:+ start:81 stop:827 length:747 start_codon:yes stop_codon:yes gene_type:complete